MTLALSWRYVLSCHCCRYSVEPFFPLSYQPLGVGWSEGCLEVGSQMGGDGVPIRIVLDSEARASV